MSLGKAFKVAQVMELAATDVAHINNRNIDKIHKMTMVSKSTAKLE